MSIRAAQAEVEGILGRLSVEDQMLVIESLSQRLQHSLRKTGKTQDLYGIWRASFPADFDLDEALDELRNTWCNESPVTQK